MTEQWMLGCREERTGSVLEELTDEVAFVKAGMYGATKSGKTYTATLLAIAIREHFELDGPIAAFDTEKGLPYIKNVILALTGRLPLVTMARSFDQLMAFTDDCEQRDDIAVIITDSVTHPWRELCDTYLERVNAARKRGGKKVLARLAFHHWEYLKKQWARFTNWFLSTEHHVITCGRGGFIYAYETNDETGQEELRKKGTKMKTENEFGYESSLLIEMKAENVAEQTGRISRRAIIIADRFNVMLDSDELVFPPSDDNRANLARVRQAFLPHLSQLTSGGHATLDTSSQSHMEVDESGQTEWHREKRNREIVCENIKGELTSRWPGRTKEETKAKTDILLECFKTRSWKEIETTSSIELARGLERLRARLKGDGDE
jgi:hypothetical protein